jgi:polar amino acid transport system substrate-binding protein
VAKIKKRGYLIAGVDENTYHFGYLNPLNNQIQGFDIDMVRAVATAIFGNPKNRIRFVSISDDQRKWAIRSGEVDIVAHTMTVTCARWKKVAFSTVYLVAAQRVLVPVDSTAENLSDLMGQKICATSGSTSLTFIREYFANLSAYEPVVGVTSWTDCLMLLQEGEVAAISTDDTILAGLAAQDPETKVVGALLNSQPYGLAMSLKHPDFVRFVNAVLARMRADGQWAASYRHWIGTPAPAPPPARYRD